MRRFGIVAALMAGLLIGCGTDSNSDTAGGTTGGSTTGGSTTGGSTTGGTSTGGSTTGHCVDC